MMKSVFFRRSALPLALSLALAALAAPRGPNRQETVPAPAPAAGKPLVDPALFKA